MKETANPQPPPGAAHPSSLPAGPGSAQVVQPDDKDCDSTETDEEDSHRGTAWMAFLALPIVYVLSIGPVAMITQNHPDANAAMRKVYAPVIWLHENTFLKRPLEIYVNLFGVH